MREECRWSLSFKAIKSPFLFQSIALYRLLFRGRSPTPCSLPVHSFYSKSSSLASLARRRGCTSGSSFDAMREQGRLEEGLEMVGMELQSCRSTQRSRATHFSSQVAEGLSVGRLCIEAGLQS